MRQSLKYISTLLVAPMLLGACNASKQEQQQESSHTAPGLPFPTPPAMVVDVEGKADYILTHLYDDVTEIDTTLFASSGDREQFFADFFAIAQLANEDALRSSMHQYFQLATPSMDSVATYLVGKYLGDPNSPIFDESSYILMMEEADKAGLLDIADQIRLSDRRELYHKNMVGELAENFSFVQSDGKTRQLYNVVGSEYTLLVFYSPDCHSCESVIGYMKQSDRLKSAIDKGLEILFIYPFEDKEVWQSSLSKMPKFGKVGMDESGVIVSESLYDLRATPTLYLLDGEGRVLLKDAFIDKVEEYLISNWLEK